MYFRILVLNYCAKTIVKFKVKKYLSSTYVTRTGLRTDSLNGEEEGYNVSAATEAAAINGLVWCSM